MATCIRCSLSIPDNAAICPFCRKFQTGTSGRKLFRLSEVEADRTARYVLDHPWDRISGGGIVPHSQALLAGNPGAGKSTMILQILQRFDDATIIEVEESKEQVKERADRIGIDSTGIRIYDAMERDEEIDRILENIGETQILVLDSLPGLAMDDQKKALEILHTTKIWSTENDTPVIVIDHITKGDLFAGLMKLQHDVDLTVALILDEESGLRTLLNRKNRHGEAPVSLKLAMTEHGLFPADSDGKPVYPEPCQLEEEQFGEEQPEPDQLEP